MLILKDMLWYLHNTGMIGFLMKLIRYLFLIIDSVIYGFIASAYEMFTFMSQIRVFESEEMQSLTNRIYILVGVVAMFFVAYALICTIINPDNATKGKNNSLTGIAKNIMIAIIGVAIVPTIFNYAYDFQKVILCNNVIEKFFLENNIVSEDNASAKMGNQLELYLFKSFYYITGYEDDTIANITQDGTATSAWEERAEQIKSDENEEKSLKDAFENIESGNGSIADELGDFDLAIYNGKVKYLFLLSTIAGLYCAYVLLGFVIDMGVRSVKLAYLQLIAPIPIFSIIVPGQKKIFDNWFKKTKNCFLEVFIRVIGLSFAFYAIKYLRPWIFSGGVNQVVCTGSEIGTIAKLLAQAIYILGVFAFLKQLPKFISDIFGIDSKGFKLGFGNALAEAGGFQALGTAGGVAGAALNYGAGAVRNTFRGARAVKNAFDYGKQNGAKAGFKKLGKSSLNGLKNVASGMADMPRVVKAGYYGYKNTENAKSIEEVKSGATSGVEQAMNEEGIISKVTGIAKDDLKGIKDIATTEYGGANRFDSKKELKKASEMDSIKSIIDSMKSTSDAINATKIKNLEQLHQTEVNQITEQYKKDMTAAANITDDATRIIEENKARDKASKAIARAQDALDVEKRALQTTTFKGNNAQIVEYRKKLANAVSDNYELVKEAMSIANSKPEYVAKASDKLFVENILNGSAFDDVNIGGEMKKSVILELGTNLNTASTQKKTAAVEQPKKKETK